MQRSIIWGVNRGIRTNTDIYQWCDISKCTEHAISGYIFPNAEFDHLKKSSQSSNWICNTSGMNLTSYLLQRTSHVPENSHGTIASVWTLSRPVWAYPIHLVLYCMSYAWLRSFRKHCFVGFALHLSCMNSSTTVDNHKFVCTSQLFLAPVSTW